MIDHRKCFYCSVNLGVNELKEWNSDEVHYFCNEHIEIAKRINTKQKEDFYKFHTNETNNELLIGHALKIWNVIDKKNVSF